MKTHVDPCKLIAAWYEQLEQMTVFAPYKDELCKWAGTEYKTFVIKLPKFIIELFDTYNTTMTKDGRPEGLGMLLSESLIQHVFGNLPLEEKFSIIYCMLKRQSERDKDHEEFVTHWMPLPELPGPGKEVT